MHTGDERRAERCIRCTKKPANGFCQLPEGALRILGSQGMEVALRRHTTLFLEGAPVRSLYYLCSGSIKLFSNSLDGRTVILRFAGPGELLGLNELISQAAGEGPACFEVSAEAMESAKVMELPVAAFRQILAEYPEAGLRVGRQLAHECHVAHQRIRLLGLNRTVAERVAGYLLEAQERGQSVPHTPPDPRVTHEEIAQCLGLSRESVCRALAAFRQAGALRMESGRWQVVDHAALEEACGTDAERLP